MEETSRITPGLETERRERMAILVNLMGWEL